MIAPDQITAVRLFGYTAREAEFLILAALHSGYFLRRQFSAFAGIAAGRADAVLVEKVIANQHAVPDVYAHNTQVYRIYSRPFYAALQQEDNRHRRARDTFSIRSKIMGFDFVLAHPRARFLPTEQEKLDYFCGQLNVPIGALPTKRYAGKWNGNKTTDRYFVDKFPIRVDADQVSFCYIDDGVFSAPGFECWLGQYQKLFAALPAVGVIYIAPNETFHVLGRKTFSRLFRTATGDYNADRAAFIALENKVAADGVSSLKQQELDRFRDLKKRIAEHVSLTEKASGHIEFVPATLPHSYMLFGTLRGKQQ
jgi:hypothetical protein